MPRSTVLPSLVDAKRAASLIGVPRSTIIEWTERGALRWVEKRGKAFLYPRDEIALGRLLREFQTFFGTNSLIPFRLIECTRPHFRPDWYADPRPMPVSVDDGTIRVAFTIPPAWFAELRERLAEVG